MKLILFDIDGTLVSVKRELSYEIFRDAFGAAHELDAPVTIPESYRFHGRTDRSIFLDVCDMCSIESDRAHQKMGLFEEIIVQLWQDRLSASNVALLPGVRQLLSYLSAQTDVQLALLTGNVELGARAKLRPHDLNDFFSFGAYGSDAIQRNDLPPIALRKASELNGTIVSSDQAVIIGDSHRDIECAHAWNIPCIAVATGGLVSSELAQHNPDLLVESLEEFERIVHFLS